MTNGDLACGIFDFSYDSYKKDLRIIMGAIYVDIPYMHEVSFKLHYMWSEKMSAPISNKSSDWVHYLRFDKRMLHLFDFENYYHSGKSLCEYIRWRVSNDHN